jgi:hypothetical protein
MRTSFLGLSTFSMLLLACAPPTSTGSRSRDGGGGGSDAGVQQLADAGELAQDDAGVAPPPADAGRPPVDNACQAAGNGNQTGSKLANLRLQNCNGDWVELHDACGVSKAQFVILVTEWCPACAQRMGEMRGLEDQHGPDLDALYVIGEFGQGVPASLSRCAEVARAKGVRPEEMLVDPDFAATLQARWVSICTDNGRFGLPQMNLLDGRDMTLRWESSCDSGVEINPIIQELMSN